MAASGAAGTRWALPTHQVSTSFFIHPGVAVISLISDLVMNMPYLGLRGKDRAGRLARQARVGGSPRFRVTKFKLKHGRRLVPTLARAHLSGSDTASKALRGVGYLRGQSKAGGGAGAGRAGRVMVEL